MTTFAELWSQDVANRILPDAERLGRYRAAAAASEDTRALVRRVGDMIPAHPFLAVLVAHAIDPERFGLAVSRALTQMDLEVLARALLATGLVDEACPQILHDARGGFRPALGLLDRVGAIGPERWYYAQEHTVLQTAPGPARCHTTRWLGRIHPQGRVVAADPSALPTAPSLPGVQFFERLNARAVQAEVEGFGVRRAALILEPLRMKDSIVDFAPVLTADGRPWTVLVDTATVAVCDEATARQLKPGQVSSLTSTLAGLGTVNVGKRVRDAVAGCDTGLGDGAFPASVGFDATGAPRVLVIDLLPRAQNGQPS